MAGAYDESVMLAHIDEMLRDIYLTKDFILQTRPRIGASRFIKMDEKQVTGQKAHYQVQTEPYSGTRTGAPESTLGRPTSIGGRRISINLITDANLGMVTDLVRFNSPIEVSEEIRRIARGDGSVVEFADRLAMEVRKDFTEARARKIWQPKTGKMFELSGTPLDQDAGALANTDTGFMCAVKNGSISAALKGMTVDIHDASVAATKNFGDGGGVKDSRVTIVDVFRYDIDGSGENSWVVCFDLAGTDQVTDATKIEDGAAVYLEGEYGYGLYSFPTWFDLTAQGGLDSIFGVNRSTFGNRWFMGNSEGPADLADLDLREHIDKMWPILEREGGQGPYVMVGDTEMLNNAIAAMKSERRHIVQADEKNNRLTAQYGFDGLIFHDPFIGPIALQADLLCPPNSLWFIKPATWGIVNAGGVTWIPGGNGMWLNMHDRNSRDPVYRADLYFLTQMYCRRPRGNLRVKNISSTSFASESGS